jgi:DNA-binding PadR family transcriptional regulator
MTPSPSAQPLRPIEFEILLALADGVCHGYAIIQEVEARSDGKMRLETGTLYRALRRLVSDGYAKPTARRPHRDAHDERRRYYSITPAGRVVAAAEAARLARLVAAARSAGILKPAKA